MASRNTAVGTKVSSDYLTYANYNDGAGGLIGYAKATSNQTGITSATPLTGLSIALTPNANRVIRIGYKITVQSSNGDDNCKVVVTKDGSTFDVNVFNVSGGSVDKEGSAVGFCLDVGPTNASHTYALQFGQVGSSPGTWNTVASATFPATLAIWDDGPSF